MDIKVGFIGIGRMGGTLLKGLINEDLVESENVIVCDKDSERLLEINKDISKEESPRELVEKTDYIILSVKPKDMEGLLQEIGKSCKDKLLISIAAGISTGFIEKYAEKARVIRIMPNTPALVGLMASAYCQGKNATKEDCEIVEKYFSALGKIAKVEEELMDAVTGLSGSGPAYIYYVIKSLAEAGVKEGLDPSISLSLTVQTVIGAAKMVEETGMDPDELIDMVKSPGGTTIEGLKVLKIYNVSEPFINAVKESSKRSRELGV